MKPLLCNDTLRLRAPEPSDAEFFKKWDNDTSLWDTGSSCAPYSLHLIEDYIANYNPDIFVTRQLRLMVELSSTGEVVGAIDIYDFDPISRRAGVGFIIDSNFRGNGYGSSALRIVEEFCRVRLNMKQLYAYSGVENFPSIKTLENASFKRCGKLRRWIPTGFNRFADAFIFQIVF
ncbi:MAG: GNAT family N-acetyltransferase [Muribaculaceae bacterium]|nr:GNAT family N-acetyltransferase [Muribaculaceae bacterium]